MFLQENAVKIFFFSGKSKVEQNNDNLYFWFSEVSCISWTWEIVVTLLKSMQHVTEDIVQEDHKIIYRT